jgi:hypothetical protein
MIELELLTTQRHARPKSNVWVSVASLSANGSSYTVRDPMGLVDLTLKAPSPRHPKPIAFEEDQEEWIRTLPLVYNAPDLMPTVLQDTNPWEPVHEPRSEAPTIPDRATHAERPVEALDPRLART